MKQCINKSKLINMKSVKFEFNSRIKRISFDPTNVTWISLREALLNSYQIQDDVFLTYVDEDDDKIIIASETEFLGFLE